MPRAADGEPSVSIGGLPKGWWATARSRNGGQVPRAEEVVFKGPTETMVWRQGGPNTLGAKQRKLQTQRGVPKSHSVSLC